MTTISGASLAILLFRRNWKRLLQIVIDGGDDANFALVRHNVVAFNLELALTGGADAAELCSSVFSELLCHDTGILRSFLHHLRFQAIQSRIFVAAIAVVEDNTLFQQIELLHAEIHNLLDVGGNDGQTACNDKAVDETLLLVPVVPRRTVFS